MQTRYQVFISSTYEDLQEERRAVSDALLTADCFPVGMEEFPAADEEQFEFIKKIIDDSDYYILIIGGRYGSLCDDGISFTEKEFDYAVEKKKTVISFIHSDRASLPVNKTDNDENKKDKLESFIKKVSTGRLKQQWNNKDELKFKVLQSISYAKKTNPQTGYIKASESTENTESLLKQINDLRIENNELKSKLNEINKEKCLIPDVADLDEEYVFTGIERIDVNNKNNRNIQDNWLNLFLTLGPKSSDGLNDTEVKSILNKYFANKENYKSFIISEPSFNTIKIQFMALGLFDSDGYWSLTDKGKKQLIMNGAIRTRK